MKILAFDQATVKSGYAVFEGTVLHEYGVIDLSKNKETENRVAVMEAQLIEMIDKQQPDMVCMEEVALQKNVSTLILLARIQGAIQGHCCAKGISLMIIRPTEWRAACGIKQGRVKREELKAQAMNLVKDAYQLDVTDDEADAICIGISVAKGLEEKDGGTNNGK